MWGGGGGFIHVPYSPLQALEKPFIPRHVFDIQKGLLAALRTVVEAYRTDRGTG